MSDLTQQTLDAIQWVREYHHDGGTMNYHHLAILELTDALTAANVREAALRKEAAEAIEAAFTEGYRQGGEDEGDCILISGAERFIHSAARRAAQRIGGAE